MATPSCALATLATVFHPAVSATFKTFMMCCIRGNIPAYENFDGAWD
jgi:hypothetical protein